MAASGRVGIWVNAHCVKGWNIKHILFHASAMVWAKTRPKATAIVQKVFDAILDTLVEEGRVELRNFGFFEVRRRNARKARNPRTGDEVFVPEKFVVIFKPGQIVQQGVEALGHRDDASARAAG